MTDEKIELGNNFYLLGWKDEYYLGIKIDTKFYEFVIPENVYKSLRRREGKVFR